MKRMSPDHIILDLVTEDIHTLEEILGVFRVEHTGIDEKSRMNLAKETIEDLWSKGFIEVYRVNAGTSVEEKLDHEQTLAVFNSDTYWHFRSDGEHYLSFLATEKGSSFYYKNPEYKDFFRHKTDGAES